MVRDAPRVDSTSGSTPTTDRQLLTPPQAAAYLQLAPRTLAHYRVRGGGPPFVKLGGRVRYRGDSLEEWVSSMERTSTSEAAGA